MRDVTVRPLTEDPPPRLAPRRPPGTGVGIFTLFAGPVVMAAGLVLTAFDFQNDAGDLNRASIAENGGRQLLGATLSSLGVILTIGSVLAVAALAARRQPRAAVWGATLSVLGLGSCLIYSVYDVALVATRDLDPASADRYGRAFLASTDSVLTYWLFPLALVGGILLGVALWRSGQVPKWAAVFTGLGMFELAAPETGIRALIVVFAVLRIAGSVPVAKALLTGARKP